MTSHTKVQLSVLVALVASVALTGCTIGITPTAEAAPSASATSPIQTTAPDAAEETTGDDEASAEPTTEQSSLEAPESDEDTPLPSDSRAAYLPMVTTELTCPEGVATIDAIGMVVNVVDDCDEIVVTGAGSVALTQKVGSLTVDAIGVVVVASDVGSITLTEEANGSNVWWESGSPAIDDSSIGSVLLPTAAE